MLAGTLEQVAALLPERVDRATESIARPEAAAKQVLKKWKQKLFG